MYWAGGSNDKSWICVQLSVARVVPPHCECSKHSYTRTHTHTHTHTHTPSHTHTHTHTQTHTHTHSPLILSALLFLCSPALPPLPQPPPPLARCCVEVSAISL